jgi:hypothetical protein
MIYITIISMVALFAVIFAFKEGYKLGKSQNTVVAAADKTTIFSKSKDFLSGLFKEEEEDYDFVKERNEEILLENIDNYGTDRPQKDFIHG